MKPKKIKPGHKGFKMTDEHKAKLAEGRRKAKEKAMEGMIGTIEDKPTKRERPQRIEPLIVGYERDVDGRSYPIFSSEKSSFKGKLYKTAEEARNSK